MSTDGPSAVGETSVFDAPRAVDRDPVAYAWFLVLGAWGLAGGAVGTAVGVTLQVTRAVADAGATFALCGMLAGAALGALALYVERSGSGARPELTDARGTRFRPLHGLVLGAPVVVAVPASLWMAVVSSVALDSLVPAFTFGMVAVGVGWGGVRVWARHRLARALESLEVGRAEHAVPVLVRLGSAWWTGRNVRSTARLNLAMLALNDGDGDEALRWVEGVSGGVAGAWAATTRALGLLLRGDPPDDAEHWLTLAVNAPGGRAVQPEADAVRVLLVWRQDGETVARQVGEQLLGPTATALHRALLATLRERAGQIESARDLRTDDVLSLLAGRLGGAIPELVR